MSRHSLPRCGRVEKWPVAVQSMPAFRKRASPIDTGCEDTWSWDWSAKSVEVELYGLPPLTAQFHPNWSNGTAGVRGTRPLNRGPLVRSYWEVRITDRIFGTSMMFGVGTKRCRLHADTFVNMIGEDNQGWGLSHKGLLWHNGQWIQFTKPFSENTATTVGMLYDAKLGTLTYYRDGHCLGIAFTGLNCIKHKLYPMVCSTAAKTEMTIANQRRDYTSLQDRCREVILRNLNYEQLCSDLSALNLPSPMMRYILHDHCEYNSDSDDSGDHEEFAEDCDESPPSCLNTDNSYCVAFNKTRANISEVPFPQY